MTGVEISPILYCIAGAFFTSCGWLDVLVYSSTRKDIWVLKSTGKKTEEANLGSVLTSEGMLAPLPQDAAVSATKELYTTRAWAGSDKSDGERTFFTDSAENLVGDIRMKTVVVVSSKEA